MFQNCNGQNIIQFLVIFVNSFDGLVNDFPMVLIWMHLFKEIKTFIYQLLKENFVIWLITNLKMHYSSSGHDERTKHTHTNTHPTPTQLLHFNNVGSFHGLANGTLIILNDFFMVLICH